MNRRRESKCIKGFDERRLRVSTAPHGNQLTSAIGLAYWFLILSGVNTMAELPPATEQPMILVALLQVDPGSVVLHFVDV